MKYTKTETGFYVRCDIGDELVSTLIEFAKENNIKSGTISGIGAVKDVVLGYFDFDKKEYLQKEFNDIYELVSLNGNFALKDNDIILHCHAVISDSSMKVFGGHLFEATIAVTGEFYFMPAGVTINRVLNNETGLFLTDFE